MRRGKDGRRSELRFGFGSPSPRISQPASTKCALPRVRRCRVSRTCWSRTFRLSKKPTRGTTLLTRHRGSPYRPRSAGSAEKDEDVDCYRFTGVRGRRVTAQVYAQRVTECIHIMLVKHPIYHMNPILTLIGPSGQIVAENDNTYGGDPFINCELPEDGDYVLQVRDVRFAGSEKFTYCIEVSDRPFLTAMFPLAVQQGTTVDAQPVGFGFEDAVPMPLTAAADDPSGWFPVRYVTGDRSSNEVPVLTSSDPQYAVADGSDSIESATSISLPCGVSGRIFAT